MGTEADLGDAVVEEDLAAEEAAIGAEVVRLGEKVRRKALQSNSYERGANYEIEGFGR
jgi:hypothetical protein